MFDGAMYITGNKQHGFSIFCMMPDISGRSFWKPCGFVCKCHILVVVARKAIELYACFSVWRKIWKPLMVMSVRKGASVSEKKGATWVLKNRPEGCRAG